MVAKILHPKVIRELEWKKEICDEARRSYFVNS